MGGKGEEKAGERGPILLLANGREKDKRATAAAGCPDWGTRGGGVGVAVGVVEGPPVSELLEGSEVRGCEEPPLRCWRCCVTLTVVVTDTVSGGIGGMLCSRAQESVSKERRSVLKGRGDMGDAGDTGGGVDELGGWGGNVCVCGRKAPSVEPSA